MSKTIVGVFDEIASAQRVVSELKTAGVPANHIRLTSNQEASAASPPAKAEETDPSLKDRVFRFFESLFDDESDARQADSYAEAWRRGHFLVVADVEPGLVDQTVTIMNRHGVVDLDRRAEHWKKTGFTGSFDRSAQLYTAEQRQRELSEYERPSTEAIPVVQEELKVGKRLVKRGGVRVHSYVEERPVEEIVRLREERINVERRPADRAVSTADATFQDRTIDVTAQGEEAVVEKRARVVEEVLVGKDVENREETVRDTVRRKDVDVKTVAEAEGAKTGVRATPGQAGQPAQSAPPAAPATRR